MIQVSEPADIEYIRKFGAGPFPAEPSYTGRF
jgi:hypothetical protein